MTAKPIDEDLDNARLQAFYGYSENNVGVHALGNFRGDGVPRVGISAWNPLSAMTLTETEQVIGWLNAAVEWCRAHPADAVPCPVAAPSPEEARQPQLGFEPAT